MALTKAQLDALCGGPPTEAPECQFPRCSRQVGPYYSRTEAREALRQHVRWVHITDAMAVPLDGER